MRGLGVTLGFLLLLATPVAGQMLGQLHCEQRGALLLCNAPAPVDPLTPVLMPLVTPPSHAALKWPLRLSLVSLMALHGADLAVTENCLGAKRCLEMNPAFAPFSGSPAGFGAGKMLGASALSWYLLAQHTRHPRLTFALALAANGWYSVVVAHNLHELRR